MNKARFIKDKLMLKVKPCKLTQFSRGLYEDNAMFTPDATKLNVIATIPVAVWRIVMKIKEAVLM